MTSTSVTRLGAAVLLSLVLTAGLTSTVAGTSQTFPVTEPTATPTVAVSPSPTFVPKVAATPAPKATPTAPANGSQTGATSTGCAAPESSQRTSDHGCTPHAVPATATYSISGTVTGTGGTPLASIDVEADSSGYSG